LNASDPGRTRARRPDVAIRDVEILDLADPLASPIIGDILIDGDRIVALGPGVAADLDQVPGDIDGSGRLAIPGLANTHFHSPGTFMKGAIPDLPLDLYMLFEVPPSITSVVTPAYAHARTLLGAVEMLKQGVTAVHDDAYFLPVLTDDEVDAVMGAYDESGIRATVALDQPNIVEYDKHAFLRDQLPEPIRHRMANTPRQTSAQLLVAYHRFLDRWHDRGDGRLRGAVSCSAPQRVELEYFEALARLSRELAIPFNMHILETRDQRLFGDVKLGMSLVRYAEEHKALDHRAQVIHAIWIDEDDIAILADRGASVAHNPVCNMRLGSGVMPFRALCDAGVNIGIGTDEANVDDGVNYWTALKIAALIHRNGEPDYTRWPTPAEILQAATSGGYESLCLPATGGTLTPGALADVVLLDLTSLAFVPRHDLRRHLVYGEPGKAVTHVIVGGKTVVKDGRLLTIDEPALVNRIIELSGEIQEFATSCTTGARELLPFYDAAYRDGQATSASPTYTVGRSRIPAGLYPNEENQ
jgi:5-methylthioadenosine/S-adenosylhomocysteine deaminase